LTLLFIRVADQLIWQNVLNSLDPRLASGVYLYRLRAGSFNKIRHMVMLK